MKTMKLGVSDLEVPVVAVGCMRIARVDRAQGERLVKTAMELGANFFDHADIYGGGASEEIFADVLPMNDDAREKVILQSKAGIGQGQFDFSKEHILEAVDGSLRRLKTSYLDVLLLHRPDALVEPEEVAEAFDVLQSSGKVRHFGVSNQNPMQMDLLKRYVKQPIVTNQLQLSIPFAGMIAQGVAVNMTWDYSTNRDGSVLDYCRLHDITIQPWSPFQHGFFKGVFLDNPDFPELNAAIDKVAEAHGVSNTTIAIAWLLRHPAKMQPVTGTMNAERLADCVKAAEVTLTRTEWYEIFAAAGYKLP